MNKNKTGIKLSTAKQEIGRTDSIIDLMHEEIPKHPNGTYFYWSVSILNRSKLRYLKDGNDRYIFEGGVNDPHLFGLPIYWDRTDMEIHLIAHNGCEDE